MQTDERPVFPSTSVVWNDGVTTASASSASGKVSTRTSDEAADVATRQLLRLLREQPSIHKQIGLLPPEQAVRTDRTAAMGLLPISKGRCVMMKSTSFSEIRVNLEQNAQMLLRASGGAMRNLRLVRASAYRMAVDLVEIRDKHLRELQAEILARWPTEKDGVDKWIAEEFRPFIALGGDPYELFRCVSDGMSLKDYLRSPLAMPLNKKLRATCSTDRLVEMHEPPPAPTPDLTLAEQLASWKTRALDLEAQVKLLRPLQGKVELLTRRMRQLQALLEKAPV